MHDQTSGTRDDDEGGEALSERLRLPVDGETALATVLDEDLVLIAGVGGSLPHSTTVLINGDPAAGVEAVILGWRRPSQDLPSGFIALIPYVKTSKGRLGSVVMRGHSGAMRYALPRRSASFEACLQAVVSDAGSGFAALADELMEALLGLPESARRMRAFSILARAVAKPDGIVEMIGDFEDGEIYLQGWSAGIAHGASRIVALGDKPYRAEFTTAVFSRDDLEGRAHGFAGVMTTADVQDASTLQRFYIRAQDGWRAIDVYDRRLLLGPREAPTHVRAILPRVRGSSEVVHALQRAGHRYDGRETVSGLPLPVRIGIDMATSITGGGLFISGWLLDPENHVRSITVKGGGHAERVDADWTRRPRPDVTNAFSAEPLFVGRLLPDSHMHGFLAASAKQAPDAPLHIEIELKDRLPAYVPLNPSRSPARHALSRLIGSLDPQLTATGVLEQQFAPVIQSINREGPVQGDLHDYGDFTTDSGFALVVGVDEGADPGVLLALLALDPETRKVPIVIAAPAAVADRVTGEIGRLAGFYGLDLRFVIAEGADDICDAFEVGVAATNADTLAFLSSAVMPRDKGWLTRLERAHRVRAGKAIVSPTIVFEDESIRWAGTWIDGEGSERALVDRYVGYPLAALSGAQAMEVTAATVECCILPRAAFVAAGGFTRGYLGTAAKSLDFGLKLKLAGTPSVWIPDVQMVAADEGSGLGPAHWPPFARRVDRLAFDRRWSLAVANMRN